MQFLRLKTLGMIFLKKSQTYLFYYPYKSSPDEITKNMFSSFNENYSDKRQRGHTPMLRLSANTPLQCSD